MCPEVHGVFVRGLEVDAETRCTHYHGDRDVVAIRFACCERYFPCFECHEAVTHHAPVVWSPASFERRAVLCGACGTQLRIADYLENPTACPDCSTPFNPGCVDHHHRYFDVGDGGRAEGDVGGS